jgi:hypothetical protein
MSQQPPVGQPEPRFVPNEPGAGQPYDGYQQSLGQPPYGYPQGPGGPQFPPQPPPRKKRHWVRNTFLGIVGLIVLIVIIGAATHKATPTAASTPTPTAQSYPSTAALLAAMTAHGASCPGVKFSSGGTRAGEVNPFATCNSGGQGNTVIIVFKTHDEALGYANSMISVGQSTNLPAAEVVGPNWTVNTVPSFAPTVVRAIGGQLITSTSSAPAASAPAAAPTTAAAAPTQAPTTPAAPAMTASQQQAVDAAQNYLSLGSGFSQYSLLKQLTSSYGSGFSQADAQFAINYLNPDWNTQAVEAAQGYMQMGGFSAASLTQQLTSSYGNGFTPAQAAYAVAKVGL